MEQLLPRWVAQESKPQVSGPALILSERNISTIDLSLQKFITVDKCNKNGVCVRKNK